MIKIKNIIQNILVVEDDAATAKVVVQMLTHRFPGFISATAVVIVAASIEVAMELIRERGPFDMVTLDGNIGNRTSMELLPILEQMGYLGKILMLPSNVTEWAASCAEKNIPIMEKFSIKTIAPETLFQLEEAA